MDALFSINSFFGRHHMKLDGMGLFVKDMATMIQVYRDVLGLEIKETEDTQMSI